MAELSEFMQRLAAPFGEHEVKWRVQQMGESNGKRWVRVLAYIDNTAVMMRLDAVAGPGNWQNRFEQLEGGVICGLSIRVGEQWITKWDGSAATATEPFKGALSGAMKRAAVMWGIGRYLHGMGEQFAEVVERNDQRFRSAKFIKGQDFRWLPPKLDAKYLPKQEKQDSRPPVRGGQPASLANILPPADPTPTAVPEVALANARAAIGRAGTVRLPGTNKSLMGFGGSEILAVPREHLPVIRERLNDSRPDAYADVISAIDEYLEATRTD